MLVVDIHKQGIPAECVDDPKWEFSAFFVFKAIVMAIWYRAIVIAIWHTSKSSYETLFLRKVAAKYFFFLWKTVRWTIMSCKIFFELSLVATSLYLLTFIHPVNIYLFKVNERNTKKMCEILWKLTIKKPERCQLCSNVFIVNFKQMSHFSSVSVVKFEQVDTCWEEVKIRSKSATERC